MEKFNIKSEDCQYENNNKSIRKRRERMIKHEPHDGLMKSVPYLCMCEVVARMGEGGKQGPSLAPLAGAPGEFYIWNIKFF